MKLSLSYLGWIISYGVRRSDDQTNTFGQDLINSWGDSCPCEDCEGIADLRTSRERIKRELQYEVAAKRKRDNKFRGCHQK